MGSFSGVIVLLVEYIHVYMCVCRVCVSDCIVTHLNKQLHPLGCVPLPICVSVYLSFCYVCLYVHLRKSVIDIRVNQTPPPLPPPKAPTPHVPPHGV